jgi:hypothetical protein
VSPPPEVALALAGTTTSDVQTGVPEVDEGATPAA